MSARSKADGPLDPHSFEARVARALPDLSPAEFRVAQFFLQQREALLLGSAVEIAVRAGASDATVVRTARSLGFDGLAELREAALADLTSAAPSPGGRLKRTLDQAGGDAAAVLHHVLSVHEEGLRALHDPAFDPRFAEAVATLLRARRRHVFGIGPSGAVAEYAALQFNRLGLAASALSVSGIGLADRLIALGKGDAILMIAYAPIYREVAVTLEQAERLAIPVVLLSDSLGPFVGDRVRTILPVPRGHAGSLAMHAATMVVIEAIVTALAGKRRDDAVAALENLAGLRGARHKDWLKRGLRKRGKNPARRSVGQSTQPRAVEG